MKLTMFRKIVLGFLLVILAIYAYFSFAWIKSQRELEENRISLLESQIKFTLQNICNKIEQIRWEQKSLVNNESLQLLSGLVFEEISYDTIKKYNSIQKELINIKNKTADISALEIYLPLRNKIITSESVLQLDYLEYKELIISHARGYQYQSNDSHIIVNLYSDVFMSFENQNEVLPMFCMRFFITKNRLSSFAEEILPKESKYVLIHKDTKEILLRNGAIEVSIDDYLESAYTGKIEYKPDSVLFSASKDNLMFFVEIPLKLLNPNIKEAKEGIAVFILFSVCMFMIFLLVARKTIYASFRKLMESFKIVEGGNFEHTVVFKHPDEFSFLYEAFNTMITKINSLINEVYIQKINRQRAELKQLQYQINPHFLYNTLSIVSRMIKFSDYDGAESMSRYLSSYYQYINRTGVENVPLIKEYQHVRNYIEIQKVRFPMKVNILLDELPENYHDLMVPRLILQPVVENAFKYGMSGVDKEGRISVSFRISGEFLIMSVNDNGANVDEMLVNSITARLSKHEQDDVTTGIVNVHKRLKLLYGEGCGIRVSQNQWGGLCCSLYIKVVQNV